MKVAALSIRGCESPYARQQFVNAVKKIRNTTNVQSLVLSDCETMPVRRPGMERATPGRRYTVELTGEFRPGHEVEGRQFKVWIVFTRFEAGAKTAAQLLLDGLFVGVVPTDPDAPRNPEIDAIVDITRYEISPDGTSQSWPVAGFPVEWQQLVAAQAMAVVLAQ